MLAVMRPVVEVDVERATVELARGHLPEINVMHRRGHREPAAGFPQRVGFAAELAEVVHAVDVLHVVAVAHRHGGGAVPTADLQDSHAPATARPIQFFADERRTQSQDVEHVLPAHVIRTVVRASGPYDFSTTSPSWPRWASTRRTTPATSSGTTAP